MQFSLFTSGFMSALLIGTSIAAAVDVGGAVKVRSVVEECKAENDCCFSTIGACKRQATGFLEANLTCNLLKFCPSMGITFDDCRADCCGVASKQGRGCPGK